MRLWHKDLISVLPRKQLLGQWRECCVIAKQIATMGGTNHILINKIMDYPQDEFTTYCMAIADEMKHRGYSVDSWSAIRWCQDKNTLLLSNCFRNWHNRRYLYQCLANLSEKYDCEGISKEEWEKIYAKFSYEIDVVTGELFDHLPLRCSKFSPN